MDPNETLSRIRALMADIEDPSVPFEDGVSVGETAVELAEAIAGLDDWLTKGGFAPDAWIGKSVHVKSVRVAVANDQLELLLGKRIVTLDLDQAAFLYKQIGRRLDMRPVGFIDTGGTV